MNLKFVTTLIQTLSRQGHRANLARGLTSGLAAQVVGFLLNLWTVAICVRILGGEYGFWLAGFALISAVGLLEFGLGPFLVRETATLRSRNTPAQGWSDLFSTVLDTYLIVACVIALLGWIVAPWIADLVTAQPGAPEPLVFALRWAAIQIAVAQPLGIWRSLLHGSQKLALLGYLALIESATLALVTTGLLLAWPSVQVLPFAALLSVTASALIAWHYTPAEIRGAVWPLTRPTRPLAHSIFKYCRPWVGAKIAFHVRERIDEPVIARFVGAEAVVMYTVTQRLVRSIPLMLLGQISSLGFAPLSEVLATGGKARVRAAVLETFPWLLLFALGSATLIWAVNPGFVGLWVGSSYYGGDVLSLVFCSWILLETLSRGLGVILYAAGEQSTLVRAQAGEAVWNLFFSLLLVGPLGVVGVAVGTSLATIASTAWAIPRAVCKSLEITRTHLRNTFRTGFLIRTTLLVMGIVAARTLAEGMPWLLKLAIPCVTSATLALTLFWREWRVMLFPGRPNEPGATGSVGG